MATTLGRRGRGHSTRVRARTALLAALALIATLLALPAAPASAAATPGRPAATALPGNASVTVSWKAPTSTTAITAYQVGTRKYSKATKKWSAWSVVSAAASSRAKTVAARNGTTYQARVRARNSAGWGSWSTSATVIAGTPRPPATISAASGNGRLTIGWTASTSNGSAVKAYQLSARTKAPGASTWSTWKTTSYSAATRKAVLTRANGSTVEYRLRATNARGAGPWSTTRSTKVGLPARVSGVVATPSAGTVAVSWTAANGNGSAVTSYAVAHRQRASASAAWGAWTTTSVAAPAVTTSFTSLDPGSQHQVTVAAVNGVGRGPASLTASATVPDAAVVWTAQSRPTSIGVSLSQGCAMVATGVRCWGGGARGDGTDVLMYSAPVDVSGLGPVSAIAVGHGFACALKPDASVWCWGGNGGGQVGNADYAAQDVVTTPVPVQGLPDDALQITAGMGTACALLVTNDVWCWGVNSGILGEATLNQIVRTPIKIAGLGKVVSIDVGWTTACAIVEETGFSAYCWGNNREGTVDPVNNVGYAIVVPQRIGTYTEVTSISTSESNTCLIDAGSVVCWGRSAYLGVTNSLDLGVYAGPIAPENLSGTYTGVFVGAGGTCLLDADGVPTCWGQLAIGGYSKTPETYTGFGQKVLEMDPARETACARVADGTVRCWGDTLLITNDTGFAATPVVRAGL